MGDQAPAHPGHEQSQGHTDHTHADHMQGHLSADHMHAHETLLETFVRREPYWQATVAVLIALLLYVTLPDRLALPIGPQRFWAVTRWLIPALELLLVVPLAIVTPRDHVDMPGWRRPMALTLVGLIIFANGISLVLLVDALLHSSHTGGQPLLLAAFGIWLTNVIVFGLWYWELDRGGPEARRRAGHRYIMPDFLFPQMTEPLGHDSGRQQWMSEFMDYMYVALTNATAFSPTDTLPLTSRAKALMAVQALVSLVTIGIVAARAVNILS